LLRKLDVGVHWK